jgi:hypothetical protein
MDATLVLIDSDSELARARALVDRLWESDKPADIARLQAQARLIAAYEESSGLACRPAQSASGDVQDRMVALSRRIFKRGGNVAGLQQRIVGEDFLTVGAGGQQIEHVLDADTKPARRIGLDRR